MGGSSGRETLENTKDGQVFSLRLDGKHGRLMGYEETPPLQTLSNCCVPLAKSLNLSELVSLSEKAV